MPKFRIDVHHSRHSTTVVQADNAEAALVTIRKVMAIFGTEGFTLETDQIVVEGAVLVDINTHAKWHEEP